MRLNTEDGVESVDFLHAEPSIEFIDKVGMWGAVVALALVPIVIAFWRYFGG